MLNLFRRCYTRQFVAMLPPSWERTAWPQGNALEDQDAWLLSALEWVRDVMNRIEVDEWKRAIREREGRPTPQAESEAAPA